MKRYLVKRILMLIPLLLGISLISFLVMHLAPGDPTALFTDPSVKPAELLRVRQNWGLDRPLIEQYFFWLWNALRGDLGTAYMINRPVFSVIMERVPATFLLMGTSMLATLLLAVPLGVISAIKKNRLFDNFVTVFSFAGMSMPSFWLALMLMLIFSVKLGIFPATGMFDPLIRSDSSLIRVADTLRHLFLPALTMTIISLAGITRFVRASMLEVLGQNYIRFARAKGLPERAVIFKHALKNALLPLITILGMMLPDLFAGAFIIETVFAWPGMGRLGVNAIFSRNYPLIMGDIMIAALLIIAGNFIADICYAFADPRVKLGDKS